MAQVSVGNYPVPNSTGANVRADINENLSDIFSTSSGSTPPPAAGSATGQLWIDTSTTPDSLKVKTGSGTTAANYTLLGDIATNLGHATAASPTFTGTVGFPAGSSSSLPIRNAADTDTGIYFGGTNELDILAGNTDVHSFTSSASEPKLPLRGTNGSASAPALSFSADTNLGLFRSAADTLAVTTGGTERAYFDSSGLSIKGQLDLRLYDSDSSNYAAIQAPTNISANYTLTLPANDGDNGNVLKTDGSGNLTWSTAAQSASTLTTARTIGGVSFDGSANINLPGVNTGGNQDTTGNAGSATVVKSLNSSPPIVRNSSNTEVGRFATAWCNYNQQSPSIRNSFNVNSVTDHGTGQFTVNYSNNVTANTVPIGSMCMEDYISHDHCLLQTDLTSTTGNQAGSVKWLVFTHNSSGVKLDKKGLFLAQFS